MSANVERNKYRSIDDIAHAIHNLSMTFTELPATAIDVRAEVENTIKALLKKIREEIQE